MAAVLLAAVVLVGCGSPKPPLVSIGAGLQGRAGYHATVVARGIPQMSAFAFDATGRLWVTRSGSTSHAHDGVYLVRNGKAAEIASSRGPLGLVWVGDDLFVSSLDGVDRFTGFDGTRFAHRTRILTGPVKGAENNNLVLAPDGRLVMGVSAACDHCATSAKYSAAVVSFATDGSDLRVVARNVRAAYGLAFDGTTLYASLNQRDDLGDATPGDWIMRIENGQDWRFPECYGQGGAACAGVPEPLGVLDAHAAAGGVAVLGDDVLAAEWVFGKVMRVSRDGGATSVFLAGLQHPLPLTVAQNGSLLVGDWGSGVIYRVARV